jgi:hypothetical protein
LRAGAKSKENPASNDDAMNVRSLVIGVIAVAVALFAATAAHATVYPEADYQDEARIRYFDAHNHIGGILPSSAYANMPAYAGSFSDPNQKVSLADKQQTMQASPLRSKRWGNPCRSSRSY